MATALFWKELISAIEEAAQLNKVTEINLLPEDWEALNKYGLDSLKEKLSAEAAQRLSLHREGPRYYLLVASLCTRAHGIFPCFH